MLREECAFCLRDIPLFAGVQEDLFQHICQNTGKRHLEKGEELFRQGEPAETVFLLKEGSVKLIQFTEEGREVIVDIAGKGDVLGEENLFSVQNWPVTAIALENTRCCTISRQQLEKAVLAQPRLTMQLISYLGSKFYQALESKGELLTDTVPVRLSKLLVRLAREHGRSTPQGTVIQVQLTQQDLADMLGVSRVIVVQALKELKVSGRIDKQGRYYLLKDKCF